ncbi:sigma-70 family RNA polymerase sigma factor [Streptomyces sp. NBC_01304]|uniref:sigma-70 family RNA polymerase sigma factor n=1 Tax=Streptomyces sp. NBC_01304 TaxID=2903818 RepID=UPI002E148A25|nr:sigma-70 family RNA polymerase sigma factor [Streptomyces sp. NBC_01304]
MQQRGAQDELAGRFEAERGHLWRVAHRMLGSRTEADDAVQEAWLRLGRADAGEVENLAAWLRTVVSRICLDLLRSRTSRREDPAGELLPDRAEDGPDPEQETVLVDSVGRALLVVLDTLGPAERVAFVLHDLFAVPFDQIAPIVDRSTVTTKKLASRARQKVRGRSEVPAAELAVQRQVVEAFLAASRKGDFEALVTVLAPGVVRRADAAALPAGAAPVARGLDLVLRGVSAFGRRAAFAEPVLVDGVVGAVVAPYGRLSLVLTFRIEDGRIAEYEVIGDPERLRRLDLGVLDA